MILAPKYQHMDGGLMGTACHDFLFTIVAVQWLSVEYKLHCL